MLKKKSYSFKSELFKKLYEEARAVAVPKKINEQICFGGVGAAVLSKKDRIYTGVCIDTDCSLGMCAERNALSTMMTNGEFEFKAVIAVNKYGKVISPCGACREFMMQLDNTGKAEIIIDNDGNTVKLSELMPYPYT